MFNLEIKKKTGLSSNSDIHHSKVPSSGCKLINGRTIWKKKKKKLPQTQILDKNQIESNILLIV